MRPIAFAVCLLLIWDVQGSCADARPAGATGPGGRSAGVGCGAASGAALIQYG